MALQFLDTTITTAGGVALFNQAALTGKRHPAEWDHILTVEAGAGAYTVEVLGPGNRWITLAAAGPGAGAVTVRRGRAALRVTVTNAEADVYCRTHEGTS